MKPGLASPFLADLGARFAGADFSGRLVSRQVDALPLPAAQPSQACAEPAAEVDLPTSAAFSRYTESCAAPSQVPAASLPPTSSDAAGLTVVLSDHVAVLVIAIAAYERCSHGRAVELALAEYVTAIGAGPLARAVADEREIVHDRDDAAECALRHGNCADGDLHAVPAFERTAGRRYPGGGR